MLIDQANESRAWGSVCSDEVHLCIAYSGEVLYEEWWDALAWIASLRRWIAPYAASSTTTQALRDTTGNKCGVERPGGCCWVSNIVNCQQCVAEGGGCDDINRQIDHEL